MAIALATVIALGLVNIAPALADGDGDFYEDASKLVSDNWSDSYIGSITLAVGDPIMRVDGEEKEIDPGRNTSPVIVGDRTLIPIRTLVEETGGEVEFEPTERVVTIIGDETEIEMRIGSNTMTVNGELVVLDTAPTIINDRTMLPVRAVAENLGFEVEWQDETREIVITRDFQTKRLIVKTEDGNFDFDAFGALEALRGPDNIAILQFGSINDAKDASDRLNAMSGIIYAEPDMLVATDDTPEQYYVSAAHRSWGVAAIGADKYAEYLVKKGAKRQITVAVVDTGVDSRHPFLSGRVLNGGHDYAYNDTDPSDGHGHGTHVAGTIVDCTPGLNNIKILPVKVMADDGKGTNASIVCGIYYAVEHSADVINMSIGGPASRYLDEYVEWALSRGVTVVAAAGNARANALYESPARVTGAITVAASNSDSAAAVAFSNYGSIVDVAAPGVNINSSVPNGLYVSWNGTSMAAPHASAATAMYLLDDPTLTPGGAESAMRKYVKRPSGWNGAYGSGIIDMSQAIPADSASPTETPTPTPTETPIPSPTITPSPSATPTPSSPSDTYGRGNTIGNDASQSVVAFDNSYIYYSNAYDGGKLYKMDMNGNGKTKLSNHYYVDHIEVNGGWVYYSYNYGDGIVKIRTDGTEAAHIITKSDAGGQIYLKALIDDSIYFYSTGNRGLNKTSVNGGHYTQILSGNMDNTVCITGDYIYFGAYPSGVYRCDINGGNKTLILNDPAGSINVIGDWIYYTVFYPSYGIGKAYHGEIYKARIDGSGKEMIYSGNNAYPLNVDGEWIYFLKDKLGWWDGSVAREPALAKIRTDGTGYAIVLSERDLPGGNSDLRTHVSIYGNHVYLLANNNATNVGNSELYRIGKDGSGLTLLQSYFSP